jgi:hypothetical protein
MLFQSSVKLCTLSVTTFRRMVKTKNQIQSVPTINPCNSTVYHLISRGKRQTVILADLKENFGKNKKEWNGIIFCLTNME